ncbi:alpha-hydroxy-acid oxidizing protein [Bradyrhizobium sp. WSM 1738]|nr:alpha-hydroxy-acid oxidizing protein [Bradyrhizobium hereditatis]
MIGRSPLYGTAVGGMSGAKQMIGILRRELDIAMALSGCKDITELDRSLLEMPDRNG